MTTVVGPNVQEHGLSVKEIVPVLPTTIAMTTESATMATMATMAMATESMMIRVLSDVLRTTIQSVGQIVSNLMIFTYFTIEFLEFIFQYLLKIHILSFVQVRHMPTLV